MTQKNFFAVSGLVFTAVTILHAVRLARGWTVILGSHPIPMWASWVGLVVAGWLALTAFQLKK